MKLQLYKFGVEMNTSDFRNKYFASDTALSKYSSEKQKRIISIINAIDLDIDKIKGLIKYSDEVFGITDSFGLDASDTRFSYYDVSFKVDFSGEVAYFNTDLADIEYEGGNLEPDKWWMITNCKHSHISKDTINVTNHRRWVGTFEEEHYYVPNYSEGNSYERYGVYFNDKGIIPKERCNESVCDVKYITE